VVEHFRYLRDRISGTVSDTLCWKFLSFFSIFLKDILTLILELHIDDIANAFILLAEEALKPNGGQAQWGQEVYYFAEADEFVSDITL
jgi:hypothetical protein